MGFFFSSRRRHTRFDCDWSSDVCSSDLRANVNSLIHLYVIGVFTAFTLAQAGMVRYWLRTRRPGWRWSALLNGVGGATTAVVTVIVIATKFLAGAWMVIVAIPVLILMFYAVRRHYRAVARR